MTRGPATVKILLPTVESLRDGTVKWLYTRAGGVLCPSTGLIRESSKGSQVQYRWPLLNVYA